MYRHTSSVLLCRHCFCVGEALKSSCGAGEVSLGPVAGPSVPARPHLDLMIGCKPKGPQIYKLNGQPCKTLDTHRSVAPPLPLPRKINPAPNRIFQLSILEVPQSRLSWDALTTRASAAKGSPRRIDKKGPPDHGFLSTPPTVARRADSSHTG